jgi:predicted ribosome quality control (RQC) complex YloA/Tae2 family protein
MKSELTSMDLHFLVRELQEMIGAKIDKIYQQEEDKQDFLFVISKIGSHKMLLRVKLPSLAYLTEFKAVFPEKPPGFCVFLRKYLLNARIKEVRQKGFERILEIAIDAKENQYTLIIELFSKGNMVLLDENNKIKGLLESQNWEARTIRGGTLYHYPPEQVNSKKITMQEFEKLVTTSQMDAIVKCFAIELGLGGFYAEELCKRINVPKEKKRLSYDELQNAYREMMRMINSPIKANVSGSEILPIETHLPAEKNFDTFSQAIDETLTEKMESVSEKKEAKEKVTKAKKLSLVIEKQEERLKELEASALENQRKGELIYEKYTEVKELLDNINSDRKKMTWEEMKKKYKNVTFDEKKGTVTIELV